MVATPLERLVGVRVGISPGVMDVQGRPVVDAPDPAVPDEEVGVGDRAIRIGHEGIQPDKVRGHGRVHDRSRSRVERQRPGQEIHPEVQAPGATPARPQVACRRARFPRATLRPTGYPRGLPNKEPM